MNLLEDVRLYRKQDLIHLHREVNYYQSRLSDLVVIQQAALGHTIDVDGIIKINPHQRRPSKESKPLAMMKLTLLRDQILNVKTFEELYAIIVEIKNGTDGVGPLWAYDTAQRIGWYLGLHPSEVFLHAGAQKGATRLIQEFDIKIDPRSTSEPLNKFPPELHSLAPYEVENFLCIWNKRI